MNAQPHKFLCLDGMRGAAAIVVALYHLKFFGGRALPENGFLAVDFFFALSGFVLAHAYAGKLQQKALGFFRFVVLRLVRLYPLYGLSIVIGACAAAVNLFGAGGASEFPNPREWSLGIGFSLLFLPDPAMQVRFHLYPLNFPAWSLFFELLVNFAWAAAVLGRGRLQWLYVTTLIVSGALLVGFGLTHGTLDSGSRWHDVYGALPRVFYSFTAGLAVYAIYRRWPLRQSQPGLLLIALLPLLLVRVFDGVAETLAELAVVLLLFPILLYLGANVTLQGRLQIRLFRFLGMISYPLYVLHRPLFASIEWGLTLSGNGALYSTLVGKSLAFAIALAMSMTAVSLFDEPIRSWLGQQFRPRRASG